MDGIIDPRGSDCRVYTYSGASSERCAKRVDGESQSALP